MTPKPCIICGTNPATIPDRNVPGRPIKRICSRCHGLRLAGDFVEIARLEAERIKRLRGLTFETVPPETTPSETPSWGIVLLREEYPAAFDLVPDPEDSLTEESPSDDLTEESPGSRSYRGEVIYPGIVPGLRHTIDDLRDEVEGMQRTIEILHTRVANLHPYLRHHRRCYKGGNRNATVIDCTCGLDALAKDLPPIQESEGWTQC